MPANRRADQFGFRDILSKDVVRRILALHCRPAPTENGPSWLTFIGHMKDRLWSLDLFRCESICLKRMGTGRDGPVQPPHHRFRIQRGVVDGLALCRMFQQAIRGAGLPKCLSVDHDPLYRFHQWEANLRILGVTEIKTVPLF